MAEGEAEHAQKQVLRAANGVMAAVSSDDPWGMTCYELREREGER